MITDVESVPLPCKRAHHCPSLGKQMFGLC